MKRRQLNKPLVLAFFGLMFIGIIMVYSSSPFYAEAIRVIIFIFETALAQSFVGLIALVTAFVCRSIKFAVIRGFVGYRRIFVDVCHNCRNALGQFVIIKIPGC